MIACIYIHVLTTTYACCCVLSFPCLSCFLPTMCCDDLAPRRVIQRFSTQLHRILKIPTTDLPTDVILLLMSSLLVIIITTTPQYRTVFSVGHCHKYYISTINDMITDNPLSYLTTVIRPSQKYLWVQMRIVKPSLNIYISIRYNQRDIYKYNSTASERLKEDCYYNIYKAF